MIGSWGDILVNEGSSVYELIAKQDGRGGSPQKAQVARVHL